MVAMSDDDAPLGAELLSRRIGAAEGPRPSPEGNGADVLKDQVEALERTIIARALAELDGNISRAAERLGLSRVGLRAKIERYDLRKDVSHDG
jgi:two-component system response regulator HupR/HoxA